MCDKYWSHTALGCNEVPSRNDCKIHHHSEEYMTVKRCEGRRLSLLAVTSLRPPQ